MGAIRRSLGRAMSFWVVASLVCLQGCRENVGRRGGPRINAAYEKLPSLDDLSRGRTVACVVLAVEQSSPELQADLDLNDLFYVRSDAEQLCRDFRALGLPPENIFSLVDSEATVRSVTALLGDVSSRLQPGDTLFVVFIGHGVGESRAEAVFYDRTLPVQSMLERLGGAADARTVLILAACHSGRPGFPQFALSSEDLMSAGGVAWLASAKGNQKAYESPRLGAGVFCHFLSEVLQNSDGYDRNHNGALEIDEIAEPVKESVYRWSRVNRAATTQEPVYGVVNWTGDHSVLPVRREWTVEVDEAARQASVRVQFPAGDLQPGDRVCIVVAPRETHPRYYPQTHVVLRPEDAPEWKGMVYLGAGPQDIGKQFRIFVLVADAGLRRRLGAADAHRGLLSPPVGELPVKAGITVTRTH